MKSTGLIRRIDDLGRIIIPKDIRRMLNLRNGSELEIYTDNDDLVLKKHSELERLIEPASEMVELLRSRLDVGAIVTDCDRVLVADKRHLIMLDKRLTHKYIKVIEDRRPIIWNNGEDIIINDNIKYKSVAIIPLVVGGDIFGSVSCFSIQRVLNDADLQCLDLLSGYFIKQLEY